jgi:DNA polymerase I-like protein with 3'-5' exonuclease and polymerase domains
VDTETNNSLDVIACKLMGLCLYTPGMKNAYIPVNHFNKDTKERLPWQITESQIKEQLARLSNTNLVFHNATFDIEVIKTTCDIKLQAYWDTFIGAKVLDENELAGLKNQYKIHINPEQDKYSIEHLFKGLEYGIFDPELFALYAATDSYMTYELYKYQLEQFNKPDNEGIFELFKTIEIPLIDVITDMELRGVCIDTEYAKKMSTIYHKKSDDIQALVDEELLRLKPIIDEWRLSPEANERPKANNAKGVGKSKNEQLSDPVELGSPTQMAILLYDVLKVGVIDKKNPRGTGAEILEELASKIPLCQLLLDKRGVDILINTFIDKMPTLIREKTGRLHAKFNQYGAATGRLSSSDPNLQNIPSHDKCVRMMFTAQPGYSIVGSDFSAQEIRILAGFSDDKEMLHAYDENKDLYAVIGSKCFRNNYEDNLEFHPVTGALQPDGKKRRSKAKTLLLGLNYGMSIGSLAEKIGVSKEEAQAITDDFYQGFAGVKKFTSESQQMLREKGFVTDMWGRRRRIPDAQLPDFEVKPNESYKNNHDFNPLIGSIPHEDKALMQKIKHYEDALGKAKWKKDIDNITLQAQKDGLSVRNNKGFISRSLRQCLNARIQGSAASMTKAAMIAIHNDPELKALGFELLVSVHDEVFGQCPRENSEAAAKRLGDVMVLAANTKCKCKFKCDGYAISRWYEDEASGEIKNTYNKYLKQMSEEEALTKIKEDFSMVSEKYLKQMCLGTYECNVHDDI